MKMIKSFFLLCALLAGGAVWAAGVNINTADAEAIAEQLDGIGIKKAQAIVDYRKKNGAFKSLNDLANVKGISDKTIEKNKTKISLGQ